MIKKYEVRWRLAARNDLTAIVEYIALEREMAALDVMDKIENAERQLADFPHRGRVVPELAEWGCVQYREIIVRPWRIIYQVGENTVEIVLVIDSRRDVAEILWQKIVLSPPQP
jgi:addiction module RelE/StbE family toxin